MIVIFLHCREYHGACSIDPAVLWNTLCYEVQDKIYVYKYVAGEAKSKIINVFEISNGKEYVVRGGVSQGDTLIVEGVGILKEGAKVSIKQVK